MASISIAVVSDTKAAVASVKDLSASYSGLVDQLRQLGPDGSEAADQLEASMKAAQLATQDAADASKQLRDSISSAQFVGAQSGLDFSAPIEKSTSAARELESENSKLAEGLKMNAGFALPMFVQGLTGGGGVVGALGSAGEAMGGMGMMMELGPMAAFAALGGLLELVTAKLQANAAAAKAQAQEIDNDTKSIVSDYYSQNSAADAIGKTLQSWATNGDRAGITLTDLRKGLDETGVSFSGVAQAIATDNLPALEQYQQQLNSQAAAEKKAAQAAADAAAQRVEASSTSSHAAQDLQGAEAAEAAATDKTAVADTKKVTATKGVRDALNDLVKAGKQAADTEAAQAAAMGKTVSQYKTYEQAMNEGASAQQSMSQALSSVDDKMTDQEKAASSLATAHEKVVAAQKELSAQVDKYGASSVQAAKAQAALSSAQQGYSKDLTGSSFDLTNYMKNLNATLDTNDRFVSETNAMIGAGLKSAGQQFVAQNQATAQAAWEAAAGNPKQQAALISAWNRAGSQSAESFGEQIGKGIYAAIVEAQKTATGHPVKLPYQADTSHLPKEFTVPPVTVKYFPDTSGLPKSLDYLKVPVGKSKG